MWNIVRRSGRGAHDRDRRFKFGNNAAKWAAAGVMRLADDAGGGEAISVVNPTRWMNGKKGTHIDYAIHTASIRAHRREQIRSTTIVDGDKKLDHDMVM